VTVRHCGGQALDWLYRRGAVERRADSEAGAVLDLSISNADFDIFISTFKDNIEVL
jgi:hypothetical protein